MRKLLALLMVLTACTPQEQADEQAVVAHSPAAAQDRDQQIFASTIERVRQEGLDTLPVGELAARIGEWFVGTPYTPGTLEADGPEALVVNLREFDCVTYLENMLAFARVIRAGTPDFESFKRELQQMRYRDGRLAEYPSRLHYFSEWISNNAQRGIVENITQGLGGVTDREPLTFMTQNRESYRQLQDQRFFDAVRERETALSGQPRHVIPETRIAEVANDIKNGDVIAATSNLKGLDVAHTGLALWRNGKLHLMHAPLVGDSVEISERPLAQRLQSISAQDGIMVARPLEPRAR